MRTIKFNFIDDEEAREFLGQLSDGWGENYVSLDWEGDFDKADTFDVMVFEDDDDYIDIEENEEE